MIKLTGRLQAIFNEILPCDCLTDIGCDHGKIIVNAVLNQLCNRAVAIDISADSLSKARILADKYNVMDRVDLRVGDGVRPLLDDDYDTVVIAGMGGLEIISILSVAKHRFNRYILLPHRNVYELRQYLINNNINPIKDEIIKDNSHFYNIFTCICGVSDYSNKALLLGKNSINNVDYINYLQYMQIRLAKLIEFAASNEDINLKLYEVINQELSMI